MEGEEEWNKYLSEGKPVWVKGTSYIGKVVNHRIPRTDHSPVKLVHYDQSGSQAEVLGVYTDFGISAVL